MFATPRITIIMPVLNGAELIGRALASLTRQTFTQWEAIVVDDGSSDETVDVVSAVMANDPRVRLIRHLTQRGAPAARNTAWRQARGEWIAYLDHDDEYDAGYLTRAWAVHQQGDVLVFRYQILDPQGPSYLYDPAPHFRTVFVQTFVIPLGVIHHRRLLDKVGGFDETLTRDDDGDLWRRFVAIRAKFIFVPAVCGSYHVRAKSHSRTTARLPLRPVALLAGGFPIRMIPWEGWRIAQLFDGHEYGNLPLHRLQSPPIVLDVGANIGLFALYAKAHYHPDARVHCFEPHSETLALLRHNVDAVPDIVVHPFALGQTDGLATLLVHRSDSGANSFRSELVPNPKMGLSVPIRNAVKVWDELSLDEVDILKIDTEGCEIEIVEALQSRLKQVRVVLAEYHTLADRQRLDALLPQHRCFATTIHTEQRGVVKYLRSDLSELNNSTSNESRLSPVSSQTNAGGPPRLMFASYHAYLDTASGAALATRDLFEDLVAHGWHCAVVCGPNYDASSQSNPRATLDRLGIAYRSESYAPTPGSAHTLDTYELAGVPVCQFQPNTEKIDPQPNREVGIAFLDAVVKAMEVHQVEVLLTYGGGSVHLNLAARARRRGIKVVFCLHNALYQSGHLPPTDAVWVPSEFARDHYTQKGVTGCVTAPWPIDFKRCRATESGSVAPFVTMVNPEPAKGATWFARIATEVYKERPDIPFLAVAGRKGSERLFGLVSQLGGKVNLRMMANTPLPSDFYNVTRIFLIPSMVEEFLPRVAVEALALGLPILASRRGALPETLGQAARLFTIPNDHPSDGRKIPTPGEVEQWVETILGLYDNVLERSAMAQTALLQAQAWQPDRLRPALAELFGNLVGQ